MEDADGRRDLVEEARRGDGRAWEALYADAYPRLLAYARRRLPSDDAARDAVSETMARAVRSLPRFRGEGAGFDAWLSGILRHVVLDAQRARGRRPEFGWELPERTSEEAGPEDLALRSEEADALRAAFARLPPADRDLLELRVVLGLSAEETATALGKRPGAVRMAQSRALSRLRGLLVEQDEVVADG